MADTVACLSCGRRHGGRDCDRPPASFAERYIARAAQGPSSPGAELEPGPAPVLGIGQVVNGAYVQPVGAVTDMEGREFAVVADYDSVIIGPDEYRFTLEALAGLGGLLLEAAWIAGANRERMRAEGL